MTVQMVLSDFEPTIAGKTHSEILSMDRYDRCDWYKTITPEEKEEAMKDVDIAARAKHSKFMTGPNNPARRSDIKAKMTGENNPMNRPNVRVAHKAAMAKFRGENNPMSRPAVRAKASVAKMGEKNPNWNDGSSFEPYCPAFNDGIKERIRNLCSRTCTICERSILQYFRIGKRMFRLHVDHLDENKLQGCDDWEWRLTSLCPSCHLRMGKQDIPFHLLLQLLLVNNKRHQTHFLFGDEEES